MDNDVVVYMDDNVATILAHETYPTRKIMTNNSSVQIIIPSRKAHFKIIIPV
jgi:hypothetical protein